MIRKILLFTLLSICTMATPLELTVQEKALLSSHPLRCISTGTWAPLNVSHEGGLIGIGLDYWELVTNKLGIDNHCREAKNWTEVLREIKDKTADITITSKKTNSRFEYANFTNPYVVYPIVIVTKNNVGFIHDIGLIKDKKLVIGKDYSVLDVVKKNYPNLDIIEVKNIHEALEYVSRGKAFATIDILPVLAYNLDKDNFNNLKISGSIPYSYPLSMMIRKDYSEMIPLINKAIDSIKIEEKNAIYKHWIKIYTNTSVLHRYLNVFMMLGGLVLGFLTFWLYRLTKKISIKNKSEIQLKKLAFIDCLTSAYNRHALDVSLDKEIAQTRRDNMPLSIIFFDLDGFKQINDTYGHKVGDSILIEFSALMKKSIRNSDIFGRWGGDEFLLILPNTKKGDAKILSEKLNIRMKEYAFTHGIHVSCCFGIATYIEGDTRESIILRGDKMLYAGKENKENIKY